jgi:hypothetical protein
MIAVPIDVALNDKRLLGAALGDIETWRVWLSILKAANGLALTESERTQFNLVAGGRQPPPGRCRELVVVASRRSGKGRMGAALAVHAAALCDYSKVLAAGEVGVVAAVSPTRAQSQILLDYCEGFLRSSELLRDEILSVGADEIVLRNGNAIRTLTSDYRSLRGRTLLLGLLDEVSFMRDERSVRPDIEVARALAPGLATTNGQLVLLSSPHQRAGLLHDRHRQYFGKSSEAVLCVAGASTVFNPTLDEAWIAAEIERDPESGQSEWSGQFRSNLVAYLEPQLIERAIDRDVAVRSPVPGVQYKAFCDPSGGVSDAMVLAIAHQEHDEIVLDCLCERTPPFSPAEVVQQMAAVMREYGLKSCRGDRFSAQWCVEAFRHAGVDYVHHDKDRSAIYMDCLPLFSSGKVRLLDHAKLAAQFAALERTAGTNGDRVDHPRGVGYHDDLSNSAAGALTLAATARYEAPVARWGNWGGEIAGSAKPSRLSQEAALWSAPSTLSASELRGTEPSPEFVRRFECHAAAVAAKASAEAAKVNQFAVNPMTGEPSTNFARR